MNKRQIEMLRHAVGADSKSAGYRNRYCTEVDDADALALVKDGLMTGPQYTDGSVGKGFGLFFVTKSGFDLMGIKEKE
jgi:hypothetical protein